MSSKRENPLRLEDSMPKRNEFNLVDRISELADGILATILSHLPLNEAAATSILSKRWRYVWAYITTFNFDAHKTLLGFIELEKKLQYQKSCRYINLVNSVLDQHRASNIKRFRLCFPLNCYFTNSINKCVQFALEKGVQVLELDFVGLGKLDDIYTFPQELLGLGNGSALEHLIYSNIPTRQPCGYIGLQSLKVLHLKEVDVTEQVLEYFLSNCPVLERLSVCSSQSLANVRVVGPSIPLKYLVIKGFGLDSIEIRDANLVSLNYDGLVKNLLLSNLPFLVEVSISWAFCTRDVMSIAFTQLSCRLSQLETLKLDIYNGVGYDKNVLPILPNLKHLELVVLADYYWGLSQLNSFMKASPGLQRLVLKLEFRDQNKTKIKEAAKCPHHSIKVVELVGYRGSTNAVEHVIYLIENAVALEKIIIDPARRWRHHHTGADKRNEDVKEEAKARDHAMHQLKEKVPSTI